MRHHTIWQRFFGTALVILTPPAVVHAQTPAAVEITGASQHAIAGPDPAFGHDAWGIKAVESQGGELAVGGASASSTGAAVGESAALLATIGDGGETVWWQEYAPTTPGTGGSILCVTTSPRGGLLAGGMLDGAGYLVRTTTGGATLWEMTLETMGVERVTGVEAADADTFLVFGESDYQEGVAGSGKLLAITVNEDAEVSDPVFMGEAGQESLLQTLGLGTGDVLVLSEGVGTADTPATLFMRLLGPDGAIRWMRRQIDVARYPVTFAHADTGNGVILLRFHTEEGVLDGTCRIEHFSSNGGLVRATEITCPVPGDALADTVQFNRERFGVVSFDATIVYLEVCDYVRGPIESYTLPLDPALAHGPDGAPADSLAVELVLADAVLRGNGDLSLAGSVLTVAELSADETAESADLYVANIDASAYADSIAIYRGSAAALRAAARDLYDAYFDVDRNEDGELSFAEAVAHRPSLTEEMFRALDFDLDGALSANELFDYADYDYKQDTGGMLSCGTEYYRLPGDITLTACFLLLLAFWGRRQRAGRRAGSVGDD